MFERIKLGAYYVSDIPRNYAGDIVIAGSSIDLIIKAAGYGPRHFFICPRCGEHRVKLYTYENCVVFCRSCLPLDIYGYRRNLYDEGGKALIVWHMRKLMNSVGMKDIRFPFCYLEYMLNRPKYMRHERYEKIIKKVQMLENMRFCVLAAKKRFTASEIKAYLSDDILEQYDISDIADHLLFCDYDECMTVINGIRRLNKQTVDRIKKLGV